MHSADYRKALRLMSREEYAGKAYPLLVAAMQQGDYRAHYALGTWYLYGRHVEKSVRKAVKLLKVASREGRR